MEEGGRLTPLPEALEVVTPALPQLFMDPQIKLASRSQETFHKALRCCLGLR